MSFWVQLNIHLQSPRSSLSSSQETTTEHAGFYDGGYTRQQEEAAGHTETAPEAVGGFPSAARRPEHEERKEFFGFEVR